MSRELYCFSFKPSDAVNLDCATVSNLRDLRGARTRANGRPAVDARIFFSEDKTRHMVNPLWLADVGVAIKGCSYGGKIKGVTNSMTCTTTWTFTGADDPELHHFDDFYREKNVQMLHVDLVKPVRVLPPQGVREFLKAHNFDEELLNNYTTSFQHYPKQESGRRDCHEFFAGRLLEFMAALATAETKADSNKVIKYSSQLQLTLATRLGLSHVLVGAGKEADDEDAMNPQTVADFENMLLEFEKDELGSFHQIQQVSGKNGRPKTLTEDLRKMCSEQACLKNPFGNIIVNSGKSTIIGGRLPVMTVSYEAAKLMGFWDHDIHSPVEGDLHNEELLKMVSQGPCRDGGAWSLHLCYNEAVHVPERPQVDRGAARTWLHETLARHLTSHLLRKFTSSVHREPTSQCGAEAFKVSMAFLNGGAFEEQLVGRKSPLVKWLQETQTAHPPSRSLVTAVQRHARTQDLHVGVRHPITQPVPHFLLMVDATKTGFALGMPPQFANLSELDYDGDRMKAAAERAAKRRFLLEQCLSVPKLRHSALGKKVVRLSGVSPLALNLAQQNGAAGIDPTSLSLQRRSSVLWRGVLETVYNPVYFFDELCAVGLAIPELMALRWSRPYFEEVRFKALKTDGTWVPSCKMAVSHDGYYPVPIEWTSNNKCAWIAADLKRHGDLFPELRRPFEVELETSGQRSSALDSLTFAQLRSLTETFTPKNFAACEISVPHLPGLVEFGSFRTFAVQQPCPWHRMARVLLKLARPPTHILGHDAVIAEMLHFAWRPSESDVASCILQKDYDLKKVGGLGLPNLPHAVQDRQSIVDLALHHGELEARGYRKEAQMLRRFAFEPPSPMHRELRSGLPLVISEAKALWEKLNLSELRCICAEPVSPGEESELEEPVHESVWKMKISFQKLPMEASDWDRLAKVAHEVGRVRHLTRPAIRVTIPEDLNESDDDSNLRDWCRIVGAVQAPRRQVWDVEESLECLATLCNDDFEYCAVLSALDALGHLLGNLLNQPTQSQVVMEEDAYCVAANLGLEDAKRRLYALEENASEDFSEVRKQTLDVLRGLSLVIANGHHNGNLHLVRAAAGLLAVDWSLKQDTLWLLMGDAETWIEFSTCRCEKLLPESEDSRFLCWKVVKTPILAPSEHPLMYCVALPEECLLQFDFPVTKKEALQLSGLGGCVALPIKPARWRCLRRRALNKDEVSESGTPSDDFNRELFDWDYRLYLSVTGQRLAPLPVEKTVPCERPCVHEGCLRPACFSPPEESAACFCRGHKTRAMVEIVESPPERLWSLVDVVFNVTPLFEAKPGIPPSDETCRVGPDARLSRALALLNDTPERLQLNLLAHRRQKFGGEDLMQSGMPFLVGNMAAPRSGDKRAASTLLRMPIFGPKYGVRARMDQPLGGEEVSSACVGAARNSAMSISENECQQARQASGNQKEVTALWNKKATLKAGHAILKRCGRIYGPPIYDRRCRNIRAGSKYLCMGLISKNFECRSCKKVYDAKGDGAGRGMRELVRRKRLLEDPGALLVSKKMRLKRFASENHALLRGTRCLNVLEVLRVEANDDAEVETRLPSDCRLSQDRESALAYPAEVVYYLGKEGLLRACRQRRPEGGCPPDLDATAGSWMLPRGHYILIEKYRVPRGEEHSMELIQGTPWEEAEWKRHRERLQLVRNSLQPRGQGDDVEDDRSSEEAEEVEADQDDESEEEEEEERNEGVIKQERPVHTVRLVGALDTCMREQETALGDLKAYVATAVQPEHISEFDDCHDRQIDRALGDLDFVVELVQGKAFRGPPHLVRYGSALSKACVCGATSTLALLKNSSEAEGCLVAKRSFQGGLSTLCKDCLQKGLVTQDAETEKLRELLPEDERDVAVLLRLRAHDVAGRLAAYRIFRWMLSCEVDARIETFGETPRFVLKDIFELQRLVNALDKEAKGVLLHAQKGVCVPHFSAPLDEALSTMNGKRTFMQTLEAQKFSCIKGAKKEMLACCRERNSMHVMDGSDEAVVGSTTLGRWKEDEDR